MEPTSKCHSARNLSSKTYRQGKSKGVQMALSNIWQPAGSFKVAVQATSWQPMPAHIRCIKKHQLNAQKPQVAAALIVTREFLRGQTHSQCTMRFYVDNEAIVKGTALSHKHGAQTTLVPEWDLIHKIATVKKDPPIKTSTV